MRPVVKMTKTISKEKASKIQGKNRDYCNSYMKMIIMLKCLGNFKLTIQMKKPIK